MGLLVTPSRREQTRYALTGTLEGRWTNSEGTELDVLPVDVSYEGFGLLINPGCKRDESVFWHVPGFHYPLEFRVLWCVDASGGGDLVEILNMCRCGTILVSGNSLLPPDLVNLCKRMVGLEILD